MQIFKSCLLASDVDGTLVGNGQIAERNIEAIRFFRSQGGTFVISTGRSATALGQVFKLIDKELVGPSVLLNGGMIYDFNKNKIVYGEKLLDKTKEYVNEVYEKCPKIGIEVHSDTNIYVIRKTEETEFHEDYEMLEREYVTFEQIKDKTWNKVLYTCNTEKERRDLSVLLNNIDKGICSFVETEVAINGEHHLYFEQLTKGTTKATALDTLSKILKIKKGGIFAIGDYYNDVEMLKFADVSACPSGSPEEIKNLANFIGGTCKNGAVADFIEYLSKQETTK